MADLEYRYQKRVAQWVRENQPEGAGVLTSNGDKGYYTDPARPGQTFERLGETWQEAAERLGLTLPDDE